MHPGDIVFCKATNRVLLAGDAVFDDDGNAYDPERVPAGVATHPYDGAPATERAARPIHTGGVADSTPSGADGSEGPSAAPTGMPTDGEIEAAEGRNDAKLRTADERDALRRRGFGGGQ